jgi:hypothetical protein
MANFYRGKAYSLLRTHGRPLNMRALASWLGKRFSHTLFLITPRDDSRYGLQTIPKIRRGRYLIRRPDGERVQVVIYRVIMGADGRLVWAHTAKSGALSAEEVASRSA